MDRRSFLYKIFSDRSQEKIFIGIQLIILDNAIDNLREIIHKIIDEKSIIEKPVQKYNFYFKISKIIKDIIFAAEYGFWDFAAHNKLAEEKFNEWIDDLNESINYYNDITFDENDTTRISTSKRYISLSMLFLFENTQSHNNLASEIENINDTDFNEKSTYVKLIDLILKFNFEYLLSDAIYLVPGNDLDGLSWEDIHSEGWEYLKPIF